MKIEQRFIEQAEAMELQGSPLPVYSQTMNVEPPSYRVEFTGTCTVEQRAAVLQVMHSASEKLKPFFTDPASGEDPPREDGPARSSGPREPKD